MNDTKKILIVEKCDGCRNRVLIEETSWRNGKTIKITEAQCIQVTNLNNKYGKAIETYPDIPKWCTLENYREMTLTEAKMIMDNVEFKKK